MSGLADFLGMTAEEHKAEALRLVATNVREGQPRSETHVASALAPTCDDGRAYSGTQAPCAVAATGAAAKGGHNARQPSPPSCRTQPDTTAEAVSEIEGQHHSEAHRMPALKEGPVAGGQFQADTQRSIASGYRVLSVYAEMFYDIQKTRVAMANRLGVDKKGKRTKAVRDIEPDAYLPFLEALTVVEENLSRTLVLCYRRVVDPSIIAWQEETIGIGDHLLARLLGAVGHPVHTTRHHWEGEGKKRVLVDDGPYERRLSDLWSYCGHGDATRKRKKGMDKDEAAALGSDDAKMIVRLMAEACIKFNGKPDKYGRPRPLSPYRQVFDNARVAYAARTAGDGPAWAKHESHGWKVGVPPKDQPENACEHCKNAALRIVGKEILRDLWIVAGGGQP